MSILFKDLENSGIKESDFDEIIFNDQLLHHEELYPADFKIITPNALMF